MVDHLPGLITFVIVWLIALIIMAVTLNKKMAGQQQQYYRYDSKQQQQLSSINGMALLTKLR